MKFQENSFLCLLNHIMFLKYTVHTPIHFMIHNLKFNATFLNLFLLIIQISFLRIENSRNMANQNF